MNLELSDELHVALGSLGLPTEVRVRAVRLLLPVVAAWGRQQAADALRDAAADRGTWQNWRTLLRDRADALSAAVPSPGVQGHPTRSYRPAQGDSAASKGIEDDT